MKYTQDDDAKAGKSKSREAMVEDVVQAVRSFTSTAAQGAQQSTNEEPEPSAPPRAPNQTQAPSEEPAAAASNAQPATLRSRRYDAEHWGKHGHSKGGRDKKARPLDADKDPAARAQAEVDAEWDLEACRTLLLQLDVGDLRTRLQNIPWRQESVPNNANWLKEAASAFGVSIRNSGARGAKGAWKTKEAIVGDVVQKVAQLHSIVQGTAAEQDETSAPALLRSRRYDAEHWGKHGHSKGGRGKKARPLDADKDPAARAQAEVDAEWDLEACSTLLLQLNVDDLRTLLQNSPWRQGKAPNNVNWLKEAASAFGVSIKNSQARGASGSYKAKEDIIEEVVRAVETTKAVVPGSAAEQDEHRRQSRSRELRMYRDAVSLRKQLPLLPVAPNASLQPGPLPGLPDRSSVRQPKVAKLVAEHGTRASAVAVAAPCKSCSVDTDELRQKERHRGSREEDAWLNVTGATHDKPSFGLGRSARMKFSRRKLSASVRSECKKLLQTFIGERATVLQIRQLLSTLPAGYDHELGIETGLLDEARKAKDVASYILLVDYRRRIADLVSCCVPVRDAMRVVLKLIEPTWASDVAAGNKFFECVANKTHWGNVFKRLAAGDLFIVAHRGTLQVAAIGEISSTPRTKVSDRAVLYAMLRSERRAAIDAHLADAATFDIVQFRKVYRPPELLEARDMLCRIGAAVPAQWQGVLHISTDEDVHTRLGELVESWPSHDNQM